MLKIGINREIIKYLAGECNDAEKKKIENWIKLSDENKKEYESQKKLWGKIIIEHPDWEVDSSWERFASEFELDNAQEISKQYIPSKGNEQLFFKGLFGKYGYLARIAAIFLIIAGGIFILYKSGIVFKNNKNFSWKEKVTGAGEKGYITLSDGTKIILNADSKLRYPTEFGGKERDVYLEGEAYFEVTHNPRKSFEVHSGNFTTIDLGTEFNVKAFPGENKFSVALVSGKVEVKERKNDKSISKAILKPTQEYTYNKNSGLSNVEEFDYFQVTGWKDNILVFKQKPMKDVIAVLYRTYGVQIELADSSIYNVKVNANFENESLWTVINTIKAFTGLNYKSINDKNGKQGMIIFYKNKRVK